MKYQNIRHQWLLSHWYIRSSLLILSSLIASGIPAITAAQSTQITGSYVASNSLTTCVALDAGALFRLIGGISLLVVPSVLVFLLIWHGLILPRVEYLTGNWAAKRLSDEKNTLSGGCK